MANHPNRNKRSDSFSRTRSPEEIIAARDRADLTQTDAAKVVHASLRGWQQWEKGDRRMHPAFFELFIIKTERK
jgi:putative transcriptional regulator